MGTTFGRLVLLAAAVVGFVCGGVGACTGPQKEPVVQPAPLTVGGTPPTVSTAPVAWPELSVMPAQGGGQNDAALVIGIQDYAYAPDVPGAAQNAEDWYQYLVKTRQVPIGSVKLLRDGEASLELMEEAAAEVAAKVKPGGTLWVVFIGHGAPAQDDGVLIGADAQQNPKSLYARSLPQKRLAELTKGQQAQTLLVLDACFSGQVSDGKMFASGLQPLLLVKMPENITVLSAGGASEFAGPLPNTARPAFSYLMLGAMRGWGDANGDKQVTAEEAVNYTRDVLQTVVKDRKQTPQASGPKIDFVLSKVEVLEQGPDLVAMVLGKPSAVAVVAPAPVVDPPKPPDPPERVLPITNPEPPTPPTPLSDSQNNNQRADSQNNNQRADRQSGDQQNNQRADSQNNNQRAEKGEAEKSASGYTLAPADIKKVINANAGKIKACALDADVRGSLKLSWKIKGEGSVADVKIVSPEFANSRVAGCIVGVVQDLRFPAHNKNEFINSYIFSVD